MAEQPAPNENHVALTDERLSRMNHLEEFRKLGVAPYPNRYTPEAYSAETKKRFEDGGDAEFPAKIAGRIMLLRSFGKAVFATVKDAEGTIQIYARLDVMGEAEYAKFKLLDIGDIVGVEGSVFRTHKGEITVLVSKFTLLAKAMNPLPEKWHGLTDVETRYRQRYVDLIINDKVKEDFVVRSKVVSHIRQLLTSKGYLEVETPMMQTIPGGTTARPFVTHHNALDMDLYLRIAPELFLKRLVVGGFDKVFELGRNFRNEGIDTSHNPEFTMLELYQAYGDYKTMMDIFEEIMRTSAEVVKGSSKFEYQGHTVDFGDWRKIKYLDALDNIGGVDVSGLRDRQDALELARSKGFADVPKYFGKWEIVALLFDAFVEEHLIDPVIIYEFPSEISPLAKNKPDDPEFAERFEPFCMAREMGNAFSELNDPFIQKEKFLVQARKKAEGDNEAMYMDDDYVNALEHGMPPAGGLGIGIDRLIMMLIDTQSIRDTILFPTLKPRE